MKTIKVYSDQRVMNNMPKTIMLKSKPGMAMNLRDLLVNGLKDIYWAEKALTKAIPTMIKNTTAGDLADALEWHLEETKDQVTRLEEVFVLMDQKVSARHCEAMEGLINEVDHILEGTGQGAVRDAGIIAAAQKIEHYEIATYGTLATFAKTIGEHDAATILEEILAEEKEADEALSQIAEAFINNQATGEDEDPDEDDDEDPDDEDDEDEDLDEDDDEENDRDNDLDEDIEEE